MSMIESAVTLLSLSRNVCRFRLLPCFLLIPFSVTPVASADAAYDLPDLVCPSGARLAKGKHFPSVEAARAALRAPPEQGAGLGVIANPNALDDQGAKAAMLQSKVFSAAGRHAQQDHRNFQSLLDTKLARLFQPATDQDDSNNANLLSDSLASASPAPGFRRLGIWGDSHLASGVFVEELARRLALQGVSVGTSFIPPYMPRRGVRLPLRAFCLSDDWRFKGIFQGDAQADTGPALAEMRSRGQAAASAQPTSSQQLGKASQNLASQLASATEAFLGLDLRDEEKQSDITALRMLYRTLQAPLELAIAINHQPERIIRFEEGTEPSAVTKFLIEAEDGGRLSTLSIRVLSGELAIQGFEIDRELNPTLSIDTLAFPGATVNGWAQLNPSSLTSLIEDRPYDAVILEYGTNEAAGDFDPSQYTEALRQALTKMREVMPKVPCLLIGAPDRGSTDRVIRSQRATRSVRSGNFDRTQRLKASLIHKQVNAIQSRIGSQFGCHSWDWQQAMGGPGAAYRWARAKPALMSRDLIHLTADGYRQSAEVLAVKLGWGQSQTSSRASGAEAVREIPR